MENQPRAQQLKNSLSEGETIWRLRVASQLDDRDIFSGLGPAIMAKIRGLAVETTVPGKRVLFRQGHDAVHFYTLVKGRVALCLGEKGHAVYKVTAAGEAFGWSSLTGCAGYTASAACLADSIVLKFVGRKLRALLAERPEESLRFYQNLSRTLDNRLHQSYDLLSAIANQKDASVSGKGRIQDPFELL